MVSDTVIGYTKNSQTSLLNIQCADTIHLKPFFLIMSFTVQLNN